LIAAIKRKLGMRYRASWLNEKGCKSICSRAQWRVPGGCPFPGQKDRKSAGNNRTEARGFPRHELGIDTVIDLEKPIEAARLDERIIGRPMSGKSMHSGLPGTYR
jgi:hypothetical protein